MEDKTRVNWKFTNEERREVLGTIDEKEKAEGERLQIIGVMSWLKMYLYNSQNKDELYKKLIAYALKEAVLLEDRLSSNVFPDRSYPIKASNRILEFLGIDRKRYYRWVRMVEGEAPCRYINYSAFLPLLQIYRRAPGVKLASAYRMIEAIWPEFLSFCMYGAEVPSRGDVSHSSNLIFYYDPQKVTEQQVADKGVLYAFVWTKQLCALLRQVVEECNNATWEPRWRGRGHELLHRKFFVNEGLEVLDQLKGKDRIELAKKLQKYELRVVSL